MYDQFFDYKIIAQSTIERYAEIYKILENSSFSDREGIKNKAIEELKKIADFANLAETKNNLYCCMEFQYLAICEYDLMEDSLFYKKSEFQKKLSKLVGFKNWSDFDIYEIERKHGAAYVEQLIKSTKKINAKFDEAMETRESFFKIIPNLIWLNPKGYLLMEVLEFVVAESSGLYFPNENEDFNIWKERVNNRLNRSWEYKEIIDYQKKRWFPSKYYISKAEVDLKNHINNLNHFFIEIYDFFEELKVAYTQLIIIKSEYLKSFFYKEQIEVIDAINDGTKLKHFLLEKSYLLKELHKNFEN